MSHGRRKIETLSTGIPINPFMSTELHKLNNDSIVVPEFMFETIKNMEEIGEKQFVSFLQDRLIYEKKAHLRRHSSK